MKIELVPSFDSVTESTACNIVIFNLIVYFYQYIAVGFALLLIWS